jgi:hypothetical protein
MMTNALPRLRSGKPRRRQVLRRLRRPVAVALSGLRHGEPRRGALL